MSGKGLVPKLRFPEFQESPAWESNLLGDWINLEYGESLPEHRRRPGPVPVIGSNGVVGWHDEPLVEGPAIVIGRKGSVGQINWIDSSCFPIDTTYYVENKLPEATSLDFIHRLLLATGLEHRRDPGAVPGLNRNQVHSISVAIPSFAEQRKIAECLTSLDELIAAEGQRLEALRKWKKALLQNLFPREGETTPRLRFPEFQDAGEWVTRPLGELLSRGPEYGLNAPAVPYSPELPTYIRITDIDDDGQFLANNKVSVAVAVSANDYLRGGDIVLARTGASVGKSYRYRPEDGDLVYAGFLIRVRPDEARLDSRLLANYLTTPQYWDWVRVTSARSGQPGINGAEYASFPVPLPQPDPDGGISEQRRIASCLGSLDTVISEQAKKLDTLKTHKQGLMQGLFPSAEEI